MVGSVPSGEQWVITAGDHEAVIVEVGGGLRTYRWGGVDIVDGYAADERCPVFAGNVLAPWPNRIRDGCYMFAGEEHQLPLTEPSRHNAIHGLVNWARWRLVQSGVDWVSVEYELPAQPGYGWPLLLRTTWHVGPAGLSATHDATNTGRTPCPFGLSAHPYLRVGATRVDDLLLQIPARSRLLVDGRLLPIGMARVAGGELDFLLPRRLGALVLEAGFGEVVRDRDGGSAVTLSTVEGASVQVWADAAFGWWQVSTADFAPKPRRRRSVAVEPMTCPPDAFRSGRDVVVLAPGQTWRGSWRVGPYGPSDHTERYRPQ
jgi:aldose 1-epimerase